MFRFEPSTFGPVSSAPTHGARIDACPTGKLRNGKALAVNLISDILACVRALATKVQPPAISRLISLRAINAVNTAPWWTLPHVGKKVLELHPSAANRYAQTAIHVVFRVFWVRASALHHCPRVVGSTCGRVSAVAMLASVKPNAARPRAKLSPTNPHLPVRGLKRLTAFLAKNRMPYASSVPHLT